jgi:CRISP-associated protein Cas1
MGLPAVPLPSSPAPAELPDYLPVRMVNEYVYCPRLFFYMWVENVFRESSDTVEGSAQHARVDKPGKGLPKPQETALDETIHSRSAMLSSERLRVIAKMDLVEVEGGAATPVDYKHGKPRDGADRLELWPTDRVQLALQGIILRENGYRCDDGVIFYQGTKQRVRVEFTDAVLAEAEEAVRGAWETARQGIIPPPLIGSPKCGGCSLAPVCLPDEVTRLLSAEPEPRQLLLFAARESGPPRKAAGSEVRRLMSARDDLRPLYLDTQGLRVGRSGQVLQVRDRDSRVVQEIRINDICQMNVMGNIQVTTQTIQALCEEEVPVCFFSQGGWFYGIASGLGTKNVFLRQRQFALAEQPWFCLGLARRLTAGKIRNQRTLLMRNHVEPPATALLEMKRMAERAERCGSMEELLGLEGNAARVYFRHFGGMLKVDDGEGGVGDGGFRLDWEGRNRRPPRDPVNAMLSLGYSMLAKDLTVACAAVGFDPMMGFYHQPRFGRAALALDLMEPFRALVADSAVLSAINTRMVTADDFVGVGESVMLTAAGRKAFYRAYEARMDTLVTHPLFEYRVSYRRLLEIQTRLLAKVVQGEVAEYPVFLTK